MATVTQNFDYNDFRNLINQLAEKEQKLQNLIIRTTNPNDRTRLVKAQTELTIARSQLENAILGEIATGLQSLEPELRDGIANLNASLDRLDNTVQVLNTINRVTGIVNRIVGIIV